MELSKGFGDVSTSSEAPYAALKSWKVFCEHSLRLEKLIIYKKFYYLALMEISNTEYIYNH